MRKLAVWAFFLAVIFKFPATEWKGYDSSLQAVLITATEDTYRHLNPFCNDWDVSFEENNEVAKIRFDCINGHESSFPTDQTETTGEKTP